MIEKAHAETIFGNAIEIATPEERKAFLDRACQDDSGLRQEVEKLVLDYFRAGSFLKQPIAQFASPTHDQPPLEKPGTQIGPYKLLQEIGEGGMGVVFLAEQTTPVQRRVALKIIKPGMDTRQVIARFEAEEQALAMMDHPNIAKIYDVGTTGGKGVGSLLCEAPEGPSRQKTPDPFSDNGGRPYFVMELVNGIPVTQFCDEQHLTARERLELFIPICQAVQHAHQKGIIHRDIKPSNILIALYDGRPVPKVIDFGVAKATGARLTEKTMFTSLGQIVGTLEYMSPEQAQRNQLDIDTRSDVYSLGVLLYELLTGDTPFDKKRLHSAAIDELLRIIREEEPPKPSTKLSSNDTLPSVAANRKIELAKLSALVRGELDWIVMKALEKDRTRRYETASSFAADVAHYLCDEPVAACPPSSVYRFGKFARRNKGRLVTASLLAAALLVTVGGVGWSVRDREAQRAEVAREKTQRQERLATHVELHLADMDQLMRELRWPKALVAAQRAEAAVDTGEAPEGVQARVQQALRDLEMVARLEEIRLETSETTERGFSYIRANQRYAAAMRDYGIDVDALPADEAVRRLRSRSGVLPALIVALDDWAACRQARNDETGGQALAELAKALDTDPWRRRLRERRTYGSEQTLEEFLGSEDLASQPPSTIAILAGELQHRGRTEDALEVLTRTLREHPDDFWLHLTAAMVHSGSSGPRHNDEAIRHYTAALALRPRSATVNHNLGHIFEKQGRLDEASDCYRKAIELNPKYAPTHKDLGNILKKQGRLDKAIDEYQAAITLDPEYVPAHINLGVALRAQGRLDDAITSYRQAIKLDPNFAPAHNNLGIVLRDKQQLDAAIACFRHAIELDPQSGLAHNNLAATLAGQGKLDQAIDSWRQAVDCFRQANELGPRLALVHFNLGIAFESQGKLDGAIADYRQAIKINPKLAAVYNNLAWLLATASEIELRNPAEAVQLAETAVQLDPSWGNWDTLSVAAYRAGDWKTSLDARQEKLQRHPIATDDRLFMAMTHWQLGDKAAARQWYDDAITEIANENTASESLSSLRQEAEQLLGLTERTDR